MSIFTRLAGAFARPPERKRSAVGPLLAIHNGGRPQWMARNVEAFAREGFGGNAVGYRCVRMIAEAAASVPWVLYDGVAELEAHPLLDVLAKPNPASSGRALMETLYGQLLVAGNAYAEAAAVAGELREIHALRPDRMKLVPGKDGWPEAYEYSAGGATLRFDQTHGPFRPVLHLKMLDPLEDHYGLSPFAAAASAVDIHNQAGAWNKALLDNSARPSGALLYKADGDANLTEEQFQRLKLELESAWTGAAGAGRPMLLEGGLDWKEMALSPKDMDYIEARSMAAREIALAFGVPPMLLGIPGDNTYANYTEANRSFWRQTVLPLAERTAESFTHWLAPAWRGKLRLSVDADAVQALAGERETLWAKLEAASFLTIDEKRAAVGYGPLASEPRQ